MAYRDQDSTVENRASKGQKTDARAKGPGEGLLGPGHLLPVPAEVPRAVRKPLQSLRQSLRTLLTSHIAVLGLCPLFSFLLSPWMHPLVKRHVPKSSSVPSFPHNTLCCLGPISPYPHASKLDSVLCAPICLEPGTETL